MTSKNVEICNRVVLVFTQMICRTRSDYTIISALQQFYLKT